MAHITILPPEASDTGFWEKVNKTSDHQWNNTECWEWTGYITNGYGQVRRVINGRSKLILAHRRSWNIHFGEIPAELYVLHRCDNRCCVNPAHLFLGTYADNLRDMRTKGRHANAKLSFDLAETIRQEYKPGEVTQKQLAEKYNLHISSVKHVLANRQWRKEWRTD